MIEAVFEDLKVKHDLLGKLDKVCPPHTIFASNTSTLSITEIAAGSGRDDRFVGMHFCLPAQLMKLVEMSPGIDTTRRNIQAAWDFCKAMGQIPVKTKDKPGFILNYFLVPFNNDAIRAGRGRRRQPGRHRPRDQDRPRLSDGPAGAARSRRPRHASASCEAFYAVTHDPRAAAPPLVKRMIAAGQLGRKIRPGFFKYDSNTMFGG